MGSSIDADVSLSGTQTMGGTTAADRAADVLLMFASNPAPLGVSDIARSLGLSKAVVHRILQSLASRRLVEADASDQRYHLGRAMTELGLGAALEYDHTWHQAGASILHGLRAKTGATATLSARVGAMRIFVDQVEGVDVVRLTVALWRPRPLYVGASGKAILAYLDERLRKQIIDKRYSPRDTNHEKSRQHLDDELNHIQKTGIALSLAEVTPDAFAVAAPIFHREQPVGAIGICGPARVQAELTEFTSPVRDAGLQMST